MQNNTAVIAQKMMNRQAPYGPVGMVSQDMSGNKKGSGTGGGGGGGGVIGLKFDTATASPGVTFSNSNITARNLSGPQTYASAKSSVGSISGASGNFYLEFIVGTTLDQQFGFAQSTFASNHVDNINNIVGGLSAVSSFAYRPSTGSVSYGGTGAFGTIASATTGDVIGITASWFGSSFTINVFKNNVNILLNENASGFLSGGNSFIAAWSSRAVGSFSTLYNSIYVQAGFTPLGSSSDTISASASVPAVADGAYDVYTFNASGTFTASSTGAVRALVIAGGGAGGQTFGAGGAGGYLEQGSVVTPQTYTVTVGAGGAGQAFTGNNQSLVSNNGNNSVFATITATGGGGGGAYSDTTATVARVGGSGGGGSLILGGNVAGAAGTTGQGFAGGNGFATGMAGGGGGGGASAVGAAGTALAGGNGGAGASSTITGTAITRGGGGGGSFLSTGGTIGTGGAGGGGDGASTGTDAAGIGVAGTANTGGGAGGSHSNGNSSTSAPGGSGVVIIRVRARA